MGHCDGPFSVTEAAIVNASSHHDLDIADGYWQRKTVWFHACLPSNNAMLRAAMTAPGGDIKDEADVWKKPRHFWHKGGTSAR